MSRVVDPLRTLVRPDAAADSGEADAASFVCGRTLDRLAHQAAIIDGVRARDVEAGDWIVIRTKNSIYSLYSLGDGRYRVAGGWFTLHGCDNRAVRVAGCTWGGCAIHTGLVAAPGMWLEFANGVRTTCIREVRLLRSRHDRTH
jgi:hypothetical protein